MVTTNSGNYYSTSDGKIFLDNKEAESHEKMRWLVPIIEYVLFQEGFNVFEDLNCTQERMKRIANYIAIQFVKHGISLGDR